RTPWSRTNLSAYAQTERPPTPESMMTMCMLPVVEMIRRLAPCSCHGLLLAVNGGFALKLACNCDAVVGALADERRDRPAAAQQSLDEILGDQLARGDLDAAAATYRELHAAYFGALPEDRAIAMSLAKVRELWKLCGRE